VAVLAGLGDLPGRHDLGKPRFAGPDPPAALPARTAVDPASPERLLAFEREDERSLHRLQKELRPVRDTTQFCLLVELMELDTKKHAILEFIRRRATERLA
jgi:hypothetical protein